MGCRGQGYDYFHVDPAPGRAGFQAVSGHAILKFFLHISKKEQKKRFRQLEDDPLEAWRVTAADWERHKKYEQYLEATEEMLERTSSAFAPWTIVEATSKWHARRKVFESIISALELRLGDKAPPIVKAADDADLRAAMEAADVGDN